MSGSNCSLASGSPFSMADRIWVTSLMGLSIFAAVPTCKETAAPAFRIPSRFDMGRAFQKDLAAAGIVYRDADGRVFDFHGLRYTFISNLARGGVHPKTAQHLARHSTIALTMDRYTHT